MKKPLIDLKRAVFWFSLLILIILLNFADIGADFGGGIGIDVTVVEPGEELNESDGNSTDELNWDELYNDYLEDNENYNSGNLIEHLEENNALSFSDSSNYIQDLENHNYQEIILGSEVKNSKIFIESTKFKILLASNSFLSLIFFCSLFMLRLRSEQ
jgi:hypothetical protein